VTFGYKSEPQNALNIIDQRVREMVRQQGLPYSNGSIPQQAVAIPRVTALPKIAQEGDEVYLLIDGGADHYLYLRSIPGWVRVSDTVPPVAPSTTFPTGPAEGDTFVYDTGTAGVRWQFVYDTSDGTTYPWLFIGGPELHAEVVTNNSLDTGAVGTGYVDLGTVGPTVTAPRNGDYAVSWGCWATGDTATAQLFMSIKRGAAATSDADGIRLQPPGVAYYASGQSQRTRTFTAVSAATALKAQFKSNTGIVNFESRWLSVKPIRVG
jgi:hypothetical protein